MGSDFNSCRFDFRLDVKTGLLPSRRRRTSSSTGGTIRASTRDELAARCSTLYACKVCGCLLRSRSDRKAHTLTHKQTSRTFDRPVAQPNPSSENRPRLVLGVTHHRLTPDCAESSLPAVVESFDGERPLSANVDFLRSPFQQQSTEAMPPPADGSHDSPHVVAAEKTMPDTTPDLTSLYFRSSDDVIRSHDRTGVSGIVSTSGPMCDNNFDTIPTPELRSDKILDLTTKTAGDGRNLLPVLSTDATNASDFRSSIAREKKSRVLDITVQKLWQSKLQQQGACAADDVTFHDLERPRSRNNGDDLAGNPGSLSRPSDEDASPACRPAQQRPSFETAGGKVAGSRSPGHGEGREVAELTLRRVVATPGDQPLYYTSLMRLQSTRRKPQPTQVSLLTYCMNYLRQRGCFNLLYLSVPKIATAIQGFEAKLASRRMANHP